MSDWIHFLNILGWMMGVIGIIALWVNHSMRKEREREKRRQASDAEGNKDAA